MNIKDILSPKVKEAFLELFGSSLDKVEFQAPPKDFKGDITLMVFPMLKFIKVNPAEIGKKLGEHLKLYVKEVVDYNVVKGFLNLELADNFYKNYLQSDYGNTVLPDSKSENDAIMVEFSSPNTNKPLHLGHIRNILLGHSVSEILKATGKKVYKTQIINDRGIHICKSMVAWQMFGDGETPESSGLKGDKLAGKYYVLFDKHYKNEVETLVEQGVEKAEAEKQAPIFIKARETLQKWEQGDKEVLDLWEKMNSWVYKGFDSTYKKLGVDFDTLYYESKTYLLGKDLVKKGLEEGVFFKKPDGSVWIDLTEEGLDEKIVLRSDGTAVYMTQDIGTAIERVKDFSDISGMIYTVGNEQDYHFKVLFLILKRLGYHWAENLYHLSYGMVDLPDGKMKSREGTVVDADDLIDQMEQNAKAISEQLGKLEDYSYVEKKELYKTLGLGALKYFILKVDPKKRIVFNPEASIDFHGNTGTFIQYTYARIASILRKYGQAPPCDYRSIENIHPKEKNVINHLQEFNEVLNNAADTHNPSLVANYTYELVKTFNSFYQTVPILNAETPAEKDFRVKLSARVGQTIKQCFYILGISVPERM